MTQFDTDAVDFTSTITVTTCALATYGLATPQVTPGGPLDQDPDSDSATAPLGEGVEIGTASQPGTVLQVTGQDPPRPTHVISYTARATAIGQAVNRAEVLSGAAQDSASATVTVGQRAVRSRVWLPVVAR